MAARYFLRRSIHRELVHTGAPNHIAIFNGQRSLEMKKTFRNLVSTILILAAIGASSASTKYTLQSVYVQISETVCMKVWSVPCIYVGVPDCIEETYNGGILMNNSYVPKFIKADPGLENLLQWVP